MTAARRDAPTQQRYFEWANKMISDNYSAPLCPGFVLHTPRLSVRMEHTRTC